VRVLLQVTRRFGAEDVSVLSCYRSLYFVSRHTYTHVPGYTWLSSHQPKHHTPATPPIVPCRSLHPLNTAPVSGGSRYRRTGQPPPHTLTKSRGWSWLPYTHYRHSLSFKSSTFGPNIVTEWTKTFSFGVLAPHQGLCPETAVRGSGSAFAMLRPLPLADP